ncbi:hypothetical protein [Novosphingobium sp. RL4]|uniref:hypothetical protein n=1 Tax=Novosphingobium TaxID=165696 RepID=UPI002D77F320|nr:hypothetical protein [Novosphingobium sp. RL4]WRT93514.1 hypothetical protein U9J33_03115 [Novosphingobium sp. RL4]
MLSALLILAAAPAHSCDLDNITSAKAVHNALANRAVQLVAAALTPTNDNDASQLSRFVDDNAQFSLGAGDVGRPLGAGAVGAKALALAMNADGFRFFGWDYMDGPADGCREQTVTVEFTNASDHLVSQVQFKFDQGRVREAQGWQRSFQSGGL